MKVLYMEKRLLNYLSLMRQFVSEDHSISEYERTYKDLMIQIAFFQHERLIHLIVTITFALLTMMGIISSLFIQQLPVLILTLLFIVLLIPYVRHYYILENGVQELYKRYDYLSSKIDNINIF